MSIFKKFSTKPFLIPALIVIGLVAVNGLGRLLYSQRKAEVLIPQPHHGYHRVISFLPSVTEMLFALDLDNEVVGVTRYCKYPPQAQTKTKIGGLLDVSYETVYHLHPDLLIVATSAGDIRDNLAKMGIPILEVEDRSISGILDSITRIGALFGREKKAAAIVGNIQKTIDNIERRTKGLPRPRVLITFLRPLGEGEIRDVYIAGNHSYFNELIEFAGGQNAFQDKGLVTSPIISPEGIIKLDPDVIIEVVNGMNVPPRPVEDILKDWKSLPQLRAFQQHKIYVLNQPYVDIPGPRVVKSLEDLAPLIHPDVDWKKP